MLTVLVVFFITRSHNINKYMYQIQMLTRLDIDTQSP